MWEVSPIYMLRCCIFTGVLVTLTLADPSRYDKQVRRAKRDIVIDAKFVGDALYDTEDKREEIPVPPAANAVPKDTVSDPSKDITNTASSVNENGDVKSTIKTTDKTKDKGSLLSKKFKSDTTNTKSNAAKVAKKSKDESKDQKKVVQSRGDVQKKDEDESLIKDKGDAQYEEEGARVSSHAPAVNEPSLQQEIANEQQQQNNIVEADSSNEQQQNNIVEDDTHTDAIQTGDNIESIQSSELAEGQPQNQEMSQNSPSEVSKRSHIDRSGKQTPLSDTKRSFHGTIKQIFDKLYDNHHPSQNHKQTHANYNIIDQRPGLMRRRKVLREKNEVVRTELPDKPHIEAKELGITNTPSRNNTIAYNSSHAGDKNTLSKGESLHKQVQEDEKASKRFCMNYHDSCCHEMCPPQHMHHVHHHHRHIHHEDHQIVLHRPGVIYHPAPTVVHRPDIIIHRPPLLVHRPVIVVHQPPVILHRPPVYYKQPDVIFHTPHSIVREPTIYSHDMYTHVPHLQQVDSHIENHELTTHIGDQCGNGDTHSYNMCGSVKGTSYEEKGAGDYYNTEKYGDMNDENQDEQGATRSAIVDGDSKSHKKVKNENHVKRLNIPSLHHKKKNHYFHLKVNKTFLNSIKRQEIDTYSSYPRRHIELASHVLHGPPHHRHHRHLHVGEQNIVLHRPGVIYHPSPTVVHRPIIVIHRPPLLVHRPSIVVHQPPVVIHRPPVYYKQPDVVFHTPPPEVHEPMYQSHDLYRQVPRLEHVNSHIETTETLVHPIEAHNEIPVIAENHSEDADLTGYHLQGEHYHDKGAGDMYGTENYGEIKAEEGKEETGSSRSELPFNYDREYNYDNNNNNGINDYNDDMNARDRDSITQTQETDNLNTDPGDNGGFGGGEKEATYAEPYMGSIHEDTTPDKLPTDPYFIDSHNVDLESRSTIHKEKTETNSTGVKRGLEIKRSKHNIDGSKKKTNILGSCGDCINDCRPPCMPTGFTSISSEGARVDSEVTGAEICGDDDDKGICNEDICGDQHSCHIPPPHVSCAGCGTAVNFPTDDCEDHSCHQEEHECHPACHTYEAQGHEAIHRHEHEPNHGSVIGSVHLHGHKGNHGSVHLHEQEVNHGSVHLHEQEGNHGPVHLHEPADTNLGSVHFHDEGDLHQGPTSSAPCSLCEDPCDGQTCHIPVRPQCCHNSGLLPGNMEVDCDDIAHRPSTHVLLNQGAVCNLESDNSDNQVDCHGDDCHTPCSGPSCHEPVDHECVGEVCHLPMGTNHVYTQHDDCAGPEDCHHLGHHLARVTNSNANEEHCEGTHECAGPLVHHTDHHFAGLVNSNANEEHCEGTHECAGPLVGHTQTMHMNDPVPCLGPACHGQPMCSDADCNTPIHVCGGHPCEGTPVHCENQTCHDPVQICGAHVCHQSDDCEGHGCAGDVGSHAILGAHTISSPHAVVHTTPFMVRPVIHHHNYITQHIEDDIPPVPSPVPCSCKEHDEDCHCEPPVPQIQTEEGNKKSNVHANVTTKNEVKKQKIKTPNKRKKQEIKTLHKVKNQKRSTENGTKKQDISVLGCLNHGDIGCHAEPMSNGGIGSFSTTPGDSPATPGDSPTNMMAGCCDDHSSPTHADAVDDHMANLAHNVGSFSGMDGMVGNGLSDGHSVPDRLGSPDMDISGGAGNHRDTTVYSRPNIVVPQPPDIIHRPDIVIHRAPVIIHRRPVIYHQSPVVVHKPPIIVHQAPIIVHPIVHHHRVVTHHVHDYIVEPHAISKDCSCIGQSACVCDGNPSEEHFDKQYLNNSTVDSTCACSGTPNCMCDTGGDTGTHEGNDSSNASEEDFQGDSQGDTFGHDTSSESDCGTCEGNDCQCEGENKKDKIEKGKKISLRELIPHPTEEDRSKLHARIKGKTAKSTLVRTNTSTTKNTLFNKPTGSGFRASKKKKKDVVVSRPPIIYHPPPEIYHRPDIVVHRPPLLIHRPSIIYHQPPVIVHRPAVVYHQPPLVFHQPPPAVQQPLLVSHDTFRYHPSALYTHMGSVVNKVGSYVGVPHGPIVNYPRTPFYGSTGYGPAPPSGYREFGSHHISYSNAEHEEGDEGMRHVQHEERPMSATAREEGEGELPPDEGRDRSFEGNGEMPDDHEDRGMPMGHPPQEFMSHQGGMNRDDMPEPDMRPPDGEGEMMSNMRPPHHFHRNFNAPPPDDMGNNEPPDNPNERGEEPMARDERPGARW